MHGEPNVFMDIDLWMDEWMTKHMNTGMNEHMQMVGGAVVVVSKKCSKFCKNPGQTLAQGCNPNIDGSRVWCLSKYIRRPTIVVIRIFVGWENVTWTEVMVAVWSPGSSMVRIVRLSKINGNIDIFST